LGAVGLLLDLVACVSDVRGARGCQAEAVLVLTGVATTDDPTDRADLVCPSIVEAVGRVLAIHLKRSDDTSDKTMHF
jgi:hypothetical protein